MSVFKLMASEAKTLTEAILDARKAAQDLAGVDVAGGFRGIHRAGSDRTEGPERTRRSGGGGARDFGGRVRNPDIDNRRVQPGFDPSRGPFSRPGPFRGSSSSSSVYVRDEGTVNEIRGLRDDLRRNGGIL